VFKVSVRVLQAKLELALKDNQINQHDKKRMDIKKEIDKEKQNAKELHSQIESMKLLIDSLDQDIDELRTANEDHKVSLHLFLLSTLKNHTVCFRQ